MLFMTSCEHLHNEQFDLFGMCGCLACLLIRLVTRVIADDFPTHVDAFEEIVVEYIRNTPDGEPLTRRYAVGHVKNFVKWCRQNDINDITEITHEDVDAFLNWPTMKGGQAGIPASSTRRNRLAGLRRAFRALRNMGYVVPDPTIDVVAKLDRSVVANICDDADVEKLRDGAPIGLFESSNSALLALAEAGATNGEIKEIRVRDLDLRAHEVRLPGNARTDSRTNQLTEWGTEVLRQRILSLDSDDLVVVNSIGTQVSESSISQMFQHIAAYGNVRRKQVNINSVRAWRARAIYTESGLIQDAALFLGSRSLDAAAAFIALEWRQSA